MDAKKESADQKRKRLEKALRENLRKRKSQQRERNDKQTVNQQEEAIPGEPVALGQSDAPKDQ